MKKFVLKRIGYGLIVLLGLSFFSFILIHLIPGDPARIMLDTSASAEQVESLRAEMGLDKPYTVQYYEYVTNALQLDLGTSYKTDRPVFQEIMLRLPATAKLAGAGMLIAIVIGVTMGIIAARFKDTIIDFVAMSISILGVSIPSFWLGIMLILVFTVNLGWFPIADGTGFKDIILPAFTLGVLASTVISRITRSGMLEVLESDFIRTAYSKGLGERTVLFIHAFRNAMIPVVTIVGIQIASLLGGTVIIEKIFNWPGLGTLAIDSILARDFPMIQGIILFIGFIFVVINILVDVLYGIIDPRVKMMDEEETG